MDWREIDEFPDYSVSNEGQVSNNRTGRILALTRNQHGIVQVGLTKDLLQYKRSVTLLVARAFLDPPAILTFTTPINLDGDRTNNHIENLMWRPKWFAIRYHKQFNNERRGFREPIMETHTGEKFKNSWQAATKYGLLDREILIATLNRTYVWPTYQQFRVIKQ